MLASSPEHFGRYMLLRRIGAGGMAEVFHARSEGSRGLGKELVIKRIQPEHTADPEFVEMFIDEARVALQLQHDNVVQVYDFGEVEGRFFMAMERVDGMSVIQLTRELIRQGRLLPVGCVLYIARCVARGLEYCHSLHDVDNQPLELVHRDICPANVLLSRRGDVKLADFGIARSAVRTFTTMGPTPKGHVAYMSPEQARGELVGPASDLFSLGVMLHELLTGRRLFKHPTGSGTVRKVQEMEIRPPSMLNAEITPDIDALVMGLLQRDCADRTDSAAAFLSALEPLLPAPPSQLRRMLSTLIIRQAQRPAVIGSASSPTLLQDETTELRRRPLGWRWLAVPAGALSLVAAIMMVIAGLERLGPSRAPALAPAAPVLASLVAPSLGAAAAPAPSAPSAPEVSAAPVSSAPAPVPSAPAAASPAPTVSPEPSAAAAPVASSALIEPAPVPDALAVSPAPSAASPLDPVVAQPREPTPAPAAVDRSAPVTVRVAMEGGWGFITVDGRPLRRKKGQDATTLLAPGLHTVQVRRSSDARVFSRQIQVVPGESMSVRFDLRQ